ncbi:MAG TPA: hypothetical protein PLO37_25190 [Candidatus Hydrogenedentes bacterium]|nr:hypothetical protein [Candidatus Hydrogenedentota bacterium]HPG70153.1 hypothetical protein [Candidatus Hydrogenedentota bacterium]
MTAQGVQGVATWLGAALSAASPDSAVAFARHFDRRIGLTEGAGLFWILAELVILYVVLVGRRHLEMEPLPTTIALTKAERWRAAGWLAGFLVLTACVLGRHLAIVPLAAWIEAVPMETPAGFIQNAYLVRAHLHMGIWMAFVAAWVALELLIVYHGWHGYRRLRRVLGGHPTDSPRVRGGVLLLVALALATTAAAQPVDAVLDVLVEVQAADALYRNAIYLYLRVAGLVWIAAEWIAAILLWRAYVLVRGAAGAPEADT